MTEVNVKGHPHRARVEGDYVVTEKRPDGILVLKSEREKLSSVTAETDGKVFRDGEFIEHLERVAGTDDDEPE